MKTINTNVLTLLLCQAIQHCILATPVFVQPKLLITSSTQLPTTITTTTIPTTTIQPPPPLSTEDGIAIIAVDDYAVHQQQHTANPETLNSRNRSSSSLDDGHGSGGNYTIGIKPVSESSSRKTAASAVSASDIVVYMAAVDNQQKLTTYYGHHINNKEEKQEKRNYYGDNDYHVLKEKMSNAVHSNKKKWNVYSSKRLADDASSLNENENEPRQMLASLSDRFFSNLMANNKFVNFSQSSVPTLVSSTSNLAILQFPFVPLMPLKKLNESNTTSSLIQDSLWKIYGEGTESKFPPFLERIVQRIQQYFSIYKYEDLSRPALNAPQLSDEITENTTPIALVVVAIVPSKVKDSLAQVLSSSMNFEPKTENDSMIQTTTTESTIEANTIKDNIQTVIDTITTESVEGSTLFISESAEPLVQHTNEEFIYFG